MTETLEHTKRKTLEGWVVSDKMTKTRVVEVRWSKREPKYGKVMNHRTKVYAHDEKNESKMGDFVRVMETRPMSKTKTWRVTDILQKGARV